MDDVKSGSKSPTASCRDNTVAVQPTQPKNLAGAILQSEKNVSKKEERKKINPASSQRGDVQRKERKRNLRNYLARRRRARRGEGNGSTTSIASLASSTKRVVGFGPQDELVKRVRTQLILFCSSAKYVRFLTFIREKKSVG